jgi:hypothetical protein
MGERMKPVFEPTPRPAHTGEGAAQGFDSGSILGSVRSQQFTFFLITCGPKWVCFAKTAEGR